MIRKLLAFFLPIGLMAQVQLNTRVDSLVKSYLDKNGNHALIVGVILNDDKHIFVYGNEKVDTNSIFELGEVTQVFTTTLLSDFVYNNIVKLDDPVQKYLPNSVNMPVHQKIVCEPVQVNNEQVQENKGMDIKVAPMVCYPDPNDRPNKILLCDLVTHTSGLPNLPTNIKNKKYDSSTPYDNYSEQNLYDYLNNLGTINPDGIRFVYSNTGIAVLATAICYKAGKNFEELIGDRINYNLKLNDTHVMLNADQTKRLVQGYNTKNKLAVHWNVSVMQGAVGLHSNMRDLMVFTHANFRSTQSSMKNILDQTHGSRYIVSDKKKKVSAVALGWLIKETNDKRLIHWQSGHTDGNAAFIGFDENSKVGVVILSASGKELDEVGLKLVELIK